MFQLIDINKGDNINSAVRYQSLDFVRGISILLMLIYHACFGLKQLGVIEASFSSDLFWLSFRALIVFLFLSLVGIGLVLANNKKLVLPSYFRRLALLLLYMSLISWLSYQVLPKHYVFFGILHLIFLSSIIGLFFVRFHWLNLITAFLVLLVSSLFSFELFDTPYLQWVGLMTFKPSSNDYAPLFPWFSFVLVGIFIGRVMLTNQWLKKRSQWQSNHWFVRIVSWAGRYSLHIYFVHFQMFYLIVYFLS